MKKLTFIACTALFLALHLPANAQMNADSSRVTRTTTTDYPEHHDYGYLGLVGLLGLLGLRGLGNRDNIIVKPTQNYPKDSLANRP